MSLHQHSDAAERARALHDAGTYGGGYAFAGGEPVLIITNSVRPAPNGPQARIDALQRRVAELEAQVVNLQRAPNDHDHTAGEFLHWVEFNEFAAWALCDGGMPGDDCDDVLIVSLWVNGAWVNSEMFDSKAVQAMQADVERDLRADNDGAPL